MRRERGATCLTGAPPSAGHVDDELWAQLVKYVEDAGHWIVGARLDLERAELFLQGLVCCSRKLLDVQCRVPPDAGNGHGVPEHEGEMAPGAGYEEEGGEGVLPPDGGSSSSSSPEPVGTHHGGERLSRARSHTGSEW